MDCVERLFELRLKVLLSTSFTATAPIDNQEEENKVERVPEDVVLFLGANRVNVTDIMCLAAVLPTDDNNERAPEYILEAGQPPPPQGQLEVNICEGRS